MARLPKGIRSDVLLGGATMGSRSRGLAGLNAGAASSGVPGTGNANPMEPGLNEAARRTRSLIGNLRGEIEARRRERMARESAPVLAVPAAPAASAPAAEPTPQRLPPLEPQPVTAVPVQVVTSEVVTPEALPVEKPADDLEKQLENYFGKTSEGQAPPAQVPRVRKAAPSTAETVKPTDQPRVEEESLGTRLDSIRESVIEDLAEQILKSWKLDEGSTSIRGEVTRKLAQRILDRWTRPRKG